MVSTTHFLLLLSSVCTTIHSGVITTTNYNVPLKESLDCRECSNMKAADCGDILNMGNNRSGIFEIWPSMNSLVGDKSITVYCDMDTDGGGWTVIQRRGDFGSPKNYFYQDWKSYKEGFGSKDKDFWLGNDNIFLITNQKHFYSVRFDLMDAEKNRRHAIYEEFWIDDEDHMYTLHISGYSGDAADSMAYHNNQPFTTKDRDNDGCSCNCAVDHKGAWWYESCADANLNGLYYNGKYEGDADGIFWYQWKGYYESLVWTEIKIRPEKIRA